MRKILDILFVIGSPAVAFFVGFHTRPIFGNGWNPIALTFSVIMLIMDFMIIKKYLDKYNRAHKTNGGEVRKS